MTTNIFSLLPYDLKLEIAGLLDHRDILALNESLRRDERVYKKLPADYALTIHILALKQKYTSLATKANDAHRGVSLFARWGFSRPSRTALEIFVNSYRQVFDFMADPVNAPIFAYQSGLKHKQADLLEYWLNEAEGQEEGSAFPAGYRARQHKEDVQPDGDREDLEAQERCGDE